MKTAFTEEGLIEGCRRKEAVAQQELYRQYAPKFFGVCRRYLSVEADIEDVLIGAFTKIFQKIDQFQGSGNFGGWMRRIVVNECLMFLRKQKRLPQTSELEADWQGTSTALPADSGLNEQEILKLLDELPDGYRTIFNLYVIEGMPHKEIAEQLDISVNTSKSQLIKARKKLQVLLERIGYFK